jgi:hypothetical protein
MIEVFELLFKNARIISLLKKINLIFPQKKFWLKKILIIQRFEKAVPLTEFGVALIEA